MIIVGNLGKTNAFCVHYFEFVPIKYAADANMFLILTFIFGNTFWQFTDSKLVLQEKLTKGKSIDIIKYSCILVYFLHIPMLYLLRSILRVRHHYGYELTPGQIRNIQRARQTHMPYTTLPRFAF